MLRETHSWLTSDLFQDGHSGGGGGGKENILSNLLSVPYSEVVSWYLKIVQGKEDFGIGKDSDAVQDPFKNMCH